MAIFTTYLSFPSDNGWWEVSLLPMCDLTESPIGKMPNTRFGWGELTIKNEPLNYKATPTNRYKLYDLIKAEDPTTNIQLKFTSTEYPNGIKGYFGVVDCDIDDDNLLIKVSPTISDVYSPIIENQENEIKLFDEHNIVVNPMFGLATNLIPDNWTKNNFDLVLQRKWLDNNTAVEVYDGIDYRTDGIHYVADWNANTNTPELVDGIGTNGDYLVCTVAGTFKGRYYSIDDTIIYNGSEWVVNYAVFPTDPIGFHQTTLAIAKYKQIKFSFSYFVSGSSTRLKDLYCDIVLYDPTDLTYKYVLDKNGKWSDAIPFLTSANRIRYDFQRTPIPLASFDKYKKFILFSDKAPINGKIKLTFYRPEDTSEWDANYKLILTNVELSVAEIELKTIQVNFNPENLITLDQGSEEIYWKNKSNNNDIYFRRRRKDKNTNQLSDYIDTVTGEPKMATLCHSDYGIRSQISSLYYNDLITIFNTDRIAESYKYELSELTVFRGEFVSGNYRDWFAIAKFSREEIRKADPYIDDSTGLPITSSTSESDKRPWTEADGYSQEVLPPPALDSGWDYTYDIDATGRLWVRKPFNEIAIPWVVGSIKGDGTKPPLNYDKRFDYYYSLTTKKAYPIDISRSLELNTAIDLRELIRKVYTETHVDLKGKQVYSSFFWNDCEPAEVLPDATLQGQLNLVNYPGANYATLTDKSTGVQPKNPLKNIAAIHTYELREAADQKINDENSILKITFKNLMDDLMVLFPNIYWFVDSTYNLHIEHLKYYDLINTPISMIADPQFAYIRNYQSWKYDKTEMYSLEEFEIKNAGYTDFKTSKITFDKLPSNKRTEDIKASYSTTNITTDIQFCKENPTSIDNGIILVAYDVDGTDNIVRYGMGQKSGTSVINGDLSISSLLYNFGRYEGTWKKGYINNDKEVSFENTKRSIEGKEITFKGILTANNIDNNIGKGLVKSKVIDFNNQLTKVVLKYRYINYVSPTATGDVLVVPTLSTVLTTVAVTVISNTSVSCSGNVTSDGNDAVTERGICYSTNPLSVTTADTKVISGSGEGVFSSTLTGLTIATNYYFRAYSINSIGISYGIIEHFINDIAEVITGSAVASYNIATCDGEVISDGGSLITERGIVYGRFPLFLSNIESMGSGIGSFLVDIPDLMPSTRYYYRAYATNAIGTAYGFRKSFITLPEPT